MEKKIPQYVRMKEFCFAEKGNEKKKRPHAGRSAMLCLIVKRISRRKVKREKKKGSLFILHKAVQPASQPYSQQWYQYCCCSVLLLVVAMVDNWVLGAGVASEVRSRPPEGQVPSCTEYYCTTAVHARGTRRRPVRQQYSSNNRRDVRKIPQRWARSWGRRVPCSTFGWQL